MSRKVPNVVTKKANAVLNILAEELTNIVERQCFLSCWQLLLEGGIPVRVSTVQKWMWVNQKAFRNNLQA